MNLDEIISERAIAPELRAANRDDAIVELLDILVAAGGLVEDRRDDALLALLKREASGGTAITSDVAIPHARLSGIPRITGAFGRSPSGVDFGTPDGAGVKAIFLFLSREDDPGLHLTLMGWIGKLGQSPGFLKELLRARTRSGIAHLLSRGESLLFDADAENGLGL